MYKYVLIPLLDSILTYILEQPIQQYFFINYTHALPIYLKSFFIFLISIIINSFLIIIIYSNIFNANIVSDKRIKYQVLFTMLGLFLSYILIYYILFFLRKYNPKKQINLLLIFFYIIGYFCKVALTYLIWK